MAYLSKIRLNGDEYYFKDGEIREAFGNAPGRLIPYGYCQTAAATVAKTVTVAPEPVELAAGLMIAVKFQYANTGSNPTLNVNNLGAIAIKRYGTTAPGTSAASNWNANSIVILTYDGTYWQMDSFNNTTYSGMTDAEYQAGTSTTNRLITPARLKAAIQLWAPIPENVSAFTNDAGYLTSYTESDPTVPSWAKAASKPTYTAQEVGALPADTVIPTVPTNVSAFTNDAGYLTSYTETDPTVPAWAKATNKPTYTAAEVGALPDTTVIPDISGKVDKSGDTMTGDLIFDINKYPKIQTQISNINYGIYLAPYGCFGSGSSAIPRMRIANTINNNSAHLVLPDISYPAGNDYLSHAVNANHVKNAIANINAIKTTAGENNTEYNLIGTATSNTNTSVVNIYNPTSISFAKTTTEGRLTLGSSSLPGKIRLYSNVTNATGYTDLVSGATSTNTRTITFPDATGTVALTSDIPSVPNWALQSSKPTYTAAEVGATTSSDVSSMISSAVSGITSFSTEIVQTLPSTGVVGRFYFVPSNTGTNDIYEEYIYVNNNWEKLGNFDASTIDLSGYVPKEAESIEIRVEDENSNGTLLMGVYPNVSSLGDKAGLSVFRPSFDILELSGVSTPVQNYDAANKLYVDNLVANSGVTTFNGQSGAITYIPPVTSVNGQTGAVTIGTGLDSAIYVIEKNSTVNWAETVAAYNAGKLILFHYMYNDFNWYCPLSSIQIKSTTGTSTGDRLVFTFTGNIYDAMNISTDNDQSFWIEQYIWQGGSTPKWTLVNQGNSTVAVHLPYGSSIDDTSLAAILRYQDRGTRNYFVYDYDSNGQNMYGILVATSRSENKIILKFVYTNDTTIITYTYDSSSSVNYGWSKSTATISAANNESVCWVEIEGTVNWAKVAEAFNNNIPIMGYGPGSGGDTLLYELRDIKVTSATNPTSSDYMTFGYVWGITSNYWTWQGNTNTWTQSYQTLSSSTHGHGSITNSGAITSSTSLASGDRLVFIDYSDSNRLKGSSFAFGSSTTQYLANNGTWQNVPTTTVTQTLTSGTAIGTVGGTTLYAPAAYDDTALAARVAALEAIPWVTYHTGNTTPTNSFGNNGDLYLETN